MDNILTSLAMIIVLGIGAQWIAWRLQLPSILLLLIAGILAGSAGFKIIDPDHLFGEMLLPVVSMAVGVILFEGGLTLKFSEVTGVKDVVRSLISIGMLITWGLITLAGYVVLQLELGIAALLGAILVVSGPTVIGPILRQVRPSPRIGSVLKWEGILIDPVGATLALFVFEEDITSAAFTDITEGAIAVIGKTLVVGLILGIVSARLLVELYKRYWVPDYLQSPFALTVLLGAFALSDQLQAESGLLTATIMGIALANQRSVSVQRILEFKETVGVLLISGLFIVLAARLESDVIHFINVRSILFLVILLLIRPITVFASTFNSKLNRAEKIFLSFMAPRGIVAAAVSAIFALELEEAGVQGAEDVVPYTFMVIIGTVIVYGLAAMPLARYLQLAKPDPQGVVLVGAHSWNRDIAAELQANGIGVCLVDSNELNVTEAETSKLHAVKANVLSEHFIEDFDFSNMGRLLAMTGNNEVNTLAVLHLREVFGSAGVYRLTTKEETELQSRFGRILFGSNLNFDVLDDYFQQGAQIVTREVEPKTSLQTNDFIPLFTVEAGALSIWTEDNHPTTRTGQRVIGLAMPAKLM